MKVRLAKIREKKPYIIDFPPIRDFLELVLVFLFLEVHFLDCSVLWNDVFREQIKLEKSRPFVSMDQPHVFVHEKNWDLKGVYEALYLFFFFGKLKK
jgi:hypothetical protein